MSWVVDSAGKSPLQPSTRGVAADVLKPTIVSGAGQMFHRQAQVVALVFKKNSPAPFDGRRGWYFRNRSEKDVTIKGHTAGFYENLFQHKP